MMDNGAALLSQIAKARESFEDGSKQANAAVGEMARLIGELLAPAAKPPALVHAEEGAA